MATAPSAARKALAADNDIQKHLPRILRIPRKAHTLAGFRDWVHSDEFPEKLKVMFLEGEVFLDMSEEDIRSHAAVKTAVCVALEILNQEIDFGNIYIDGVLVTNDAANVSNNPDAVAVSWQSVDRARRIT
jgi:hypothetical protein